MADIHAAAFRETRSWTAGEFRDLLAQPFTAAFTAPGGFALCRTLAGETELLTIAVAPEHQRRGIARALLNRWLDDAAQHADTAFLEVAADNDPARALYSALSFTINGRRRDYYRRVDEPAVDALLMSRALTSGQAAPDRPPKPESS